MFGWWHNLKAKQAAKIKQRQEIHKERIEVLKNEVDALKMAMLLRPCPLNSNENCFEKCTHFKNGHVLPLPSFNTGEILYTSVGPRCKLWS